MFNTSIWAIILITLGVLLLLKSFFGIAIPVFRIAMGGLFIYAGVSLLIKKPSLKTQYRNIMFSKRSVSSKKAANSFHVVFGDGDIDLSQIAIEKPTKLEVNVVFGNADLKVNPAIPTKIIAKTAFGRSSLPDDTQITFGKYIYYTQGKDQETLLEIHTNVAFGNLQVETD